MERVIAAFEYLPFVGLFTGSRVSEKAWMQILQGVVIAVITAAGSSWMTVQITTSVTETEVQHLQNSIHELKGHIAVMNGLYIEHLREHAGMVGGHR